MGNVLQIGHTSGDASKKRPQPPVKVIATTAGKGGVGKTAVSINLALALAKLGKQTMLLDADLGLANIDTQLGLHPRFNLSHVIDGSCQLADIIVPVCPLVRLVPAASGILRMAELPGPQQAGIVSAFSDLSSDLDVLIIDNAPGMSSNIMRFVKAAHEAIVVVCDEPASITDAYAVIKVLSRDYGVTRFQILPNMVRGPTQARNLFEKILRAADRFLDVTLVPLPGIPYDEYLRRSIQEQVGVVHRYPRSPSATAFNKLAQSITTWPLPARPRGHVEFFVERIIENSAAARRIT